VGALTPLKSVTATGARSKMTLGISSSLLPRKRAQVCGRQSVPRQHGALQSHSNARRRCPFATCTVRQQRMLRY